MRGVILIGVILIALFAFQCYFRVLEFAGSKTKSSESAVWKSVLVPSLKKPRSFQRTWMSQCQQDRIVHFLNPQPGYFIDLASNDPVWISNTFCLERFKHWTGICLEANSDYWYETLAIRSCVLVGGAVFEQQGEELKFSMNGWGGGIISQSMDNKPNTTSKPTVSGLASRDVLAPTGTLDNILLQVGAPRVIDYLSLDVEGAELECMKTLDLSRTRFKIMTIERPKPELKNLLISHGYVMTHNLSWFGETLWLDKAHPKLHEIAGLSLEALLDKVNKEVGSP